MESGELHPKDVKVRLAKELTARFYDEDAAVGAERNFEQVFAKHELPEDLPEFEMTVEEEEIWFQNCLLEAGLVKSTSDGRRMIKQNAVSVEGEKVSDVDAHIQAQGKVLLKVGKRRFCQVIFV